MFNCIFFNKSHHQTSASLKTPQYLVFISFNVSKQYVQLRSNGEIYVILFALKRKQSKKKYQYVFLCFVTGKQSNKYSCYSKSYTQLRQILLCHKIIEPQYNLSWKGYLEVIQSKLLLRRDLARSCLCTPRDDQFQ